MRVNRRQFLLGGLSAGIAATIARDFQSYQKQSKLQSIAEAQIAQDPESFLEATFNADVENINRGRSIRESLRLTPPNILYDNQISQLLIQCSRIATQQYLTGKLLPTYDGSIKQLPAYSERLAGYKQIASFRGKEAVVSRAVEIELPSHNLTLDPIEENLNEAERTIGKTIKEVVKIRRETPVFLGFVLSSPQNNIIVFRGTQTNAEWINNLTAIQIPYTDPISGQYFGRVHEGFIKNYLKIIKPLPRQVAQSLNPAIPCYVTGHSLGASLAIISALDFALNVPKLRAQLQLYTYASPRVGDLTFATLHSRMIPNSYRVVNLADVITMMPPTLGVGTYVHLGQEWSFLSAQGDIMPNHVVDTYRNAIDRQEERQR
jgi:triacylglycerol lipase